jgi:hypothetical protein
MEIEEVRVGPHEDRRVEYDSKHNPSRGGRETKKNDLKNGVLSRLKHVITRRIRGWYLWHARFIVC